MNTERFSSCLRELGAVWDGLLPEARHIVDDSREVGPGDIFVLRQGATALSQAQMRRFCESAVAAGACAVIADPGADVPTSLPVIRLAEPHRHLGALAEGFYGSPSRRMKVVAVTGTNGKTTTTYLIEALARNLGLRVGVLGTISYRYPGYSEPAPNTTPGTLKLYRLMAAMADAGCDIVAMEVSSHGIVQGRVDGVLFDAAIWNNLGTDHLDFHGTREAYALAKQRLFDHYLVEAFRAGKRPVAVANADDPEVVSHIRDAHPESWGGRVVSFSSATAQADIALRDLQWRNGAWQLEIHDAQGTVIPSSLSLIGAYNAANAAGAIAALHALGYGLRDIAEALPHVPQIPGRMECVAKAPTVIVDFAHTPEALENALDAARGCVHDGGRLIAVFGAGGDRDPSKRPMMGAAAAKLSDLVYVTSDNPRTENPDDIIRQIMAGIPEGVNACAITDRNAAIRAAVRCASGNDVILVAGKGHEDYQIIGTQKQHFDDREVCRDALRGE